MGIIEAKNMKNLKKDCISQDVYEHETGLCRKLSKENGGRCNWGECEKCGVLPLLIKLHRGVLLEDALAIRQEKDKILQ